MPLFFRLGGLARSLISARIGARQSNRLGNLSCGFFPYGVDDPCITFGSFLDHFGPFCSLYFQLCANCLVDLCIIFWNPNCWNN